jgi:hypothetical protein
MPGVDDPFTPGKSPDPNAGVEPGTFDKVRQEWSTFLEDPKGRAALMSAGIALMQPQWGGNTTSAIGQAIGAAGQSATANQAMDIRESEAESKQDLRSSQAQAAEARAGAAGARAGAAGDRLQFQREKLQSDQQLRTMGLRIRANSDYNRYVKALEDQNIKGPLLDTKYVPKPSPSFKDYVSANPALRGLIDSGDDEDTPAPKAGSGAKAKSSEDSAALDWANANSGDPRAKAIKQRLGVE